MYMRDGENDLKAIHNVRLKIAFDGSETPAVDQPLDTFFGTFLDNEPVEVNVLRIAFDDWMKLWVNGEHVITLRHDEGFDIARVPVHLCKGTNRVLLKLSNSINREFGAWAFNLAVQSRPSHQEG